MCAALEAITTSARLDIARGLDGGSTWQPEQFAKIYAELVKGRMIGNVQRHSLSYESASQDYGLAAIRGLISANLLYSRPYSGQSYSCTTLTVASGMRVPFAW